MPDNRTTELRISEPLRGFIRHQSNRAYIDGGQARWLTKIADEIDAKHEQTISATLGSDEIYDAGFANGVKATLQQLDGLIASGYDMKAVSAWIDEQWEES